MTQTAAEQRVRNYYAPLAVRCTESAAHTWVIWVEDRDCTYLAEKTTEAKAWEYAAKYLEEKHP
jgi:hypothetical protein